MAKIITLINHKGGVGKSTSTLNIAATLRDLGNKVLVIDLDSQANLTGAIYGEEPQHTIGKVLVGEVTFEQAVIKTDVGLDLIPSSFKLNKYEKEVAEEKFAEFTLKNKLDIPAVRAYDYVLIDTPPALGLLTINALLFTDYYLVPLQADKFSVQGIKNILESASTIKKFNSNLEFIGAFLTLFNKASNKIVDRDVYSYLKEELGSKLLDSTIRENTTIKAAIISNQDIYTYDGKSNGAIDYKALTTEVLEKI